MEQENIESKEQGKYWHRFWTIPNAFTMLRIASSVGLVSYLAVQGLNPLTCFGITSNFWLPAWAVATAATDFIDGTLARTLHQQSKWGQALDPIADKIQNWGIALTLMAHRVMPLWVLTIGARDLAVGIFTARKKYQDGKKQNEQEQNKKQNIKKSNKENKLDKLKSYYHTFAKGEAPSPTFPAKMKMALQSVGAIATLAFGFGTSNFTLLGSVMALSIATMVLPDKLPIKNKAKNIIQFLGTISVTSIGIILGGVSSIAPVMMASAISMVVPEVFAIKKEYLKKKKRSQQKKDIVKKSAPVESVIKQDSEKQKTKSFVNTVTVEPQINPDYTKIDKWIEEQMLNKNSIEEQNQNDKGFQKTLRK